MASPKSKRVEHRGEAHPGRGRPGPGRLAMTSMFLSPTEIGRPLRADFAYRRPGIRVNRPSDPFPECRPSTRQFTSTGTRISDECA